MSSSSSGSGGGGVDAGGACGFPPTDAGPLNVLYTGGTAAPLCPSTLDGPGFPNNSWFSYNDGTVEGGTVLHMGTTGGCDGPSDCAFHAMGQGYTGYGAGVGFTLNNNAIYDASRFTGFSVWFKGTTTGTRTFSYTAANNVVHVKFVTGFDDGSMTDPRNGDDYGTYCSTANADGGTGDWVQCMIPFAALSRDGFRHADAGAPEPSLDSFDPQNLVKIQFEFSAFNGPDGGTPNPVGFDVLIDDVAFY